MGDQNMALDWRRINGYLDRGGVVIIHDHAVQGWVNELRNPEHWVPGCLAVDVEGNCWITHGGDEQNGAATWTLKGANIRHVCEASSCPPESKTRKNW